MSHPIQPPEPNDPGPVLTSPEVPEIIPQIREIFNEAMAEVGPPGPDDTKALEEPGRTRAGAESQRLLHAGLRVQ
jgi:hypothetical protein